jgi:hypothetical protein
MQTRERCTVVHILCAVLPGPAICAETDVLEHEVEATTVVITRSGRALVAVDRTNIYAVGLSFGFATRQG